MERVSQLNRKLVSAVGFSRGWARSTLKNPPPLVPSCMMEDMKPAGPRAMVCVTPLSPSWMLTGPANVCTAPWPTTTMPATKEIGSRM